MRTYAGRRVLAGRHGLSGILQPRGAPDRRPAPESRRIIHYGHSSITMTAWVVDRFDPGEPLVFGWSVGGAHPVVLELGEAVDVAADAAGVW